MTAATSTARLASVEPARALAASLAILSALGAIVAARLVASGSGIDPLVVGAAFGAALVALTFAAQLRDRAVAAPVQQRHRFRSIGIGLGIGTAAGLALAALAVVGPAIGGSTYVPGLGRPAAPFVPWALITIVVATAEEGVLRGALFDRLQRLAGAAPAVVVTTVAFALMHVPLYGWHVVPLDLAVGLVLAGLRLSTRGLVAPAAAHVVADLATWWL